MKALRDKPPKFADIKVFDRKGNKGGGRDIGKFSKSVKLKDNPKTEEQNFTKARHPHE